MSALSFDESGSPDYAEYDIVNLGRTGFIQVRTFLSLCKWNQREIFLNRYQYIKIKPLHVK